MKPTITWYNSGSIREKFFEQYGKKVGRYKCFYEDGSIKIVCYYVNGLLNGKYILFHNNGQKSEERLFKMGIENGRHIGYTYDGKVYEKWFVRNGKIDGIHISYYKNMTTLGKCCHINGKKEWKMEEFFDNTKIQKQQMFIGGKLYGRSKIYNGDGTSLICDYTNNNKNGRSKEYFDGGILRISSFYIADKMNDYYFEYNVHGNLLRQYYYEENRMIKNYIFSSDKTHYIEYHANGKIKIDGYCKNGKKIGLCKEYSNEGKLIKTDEYKNDEINCTECIFYNDKLREIRNYERGKLHGLRMTYYRSGNRYEVYQYNHGKLHGLQKVYFEMPENGLLSKKFYFNGKMDGEQYNTETVGLCKYFIINKKLEALKINLYKGKFWWSYEYVGGKVIGKYVDRMEYSPQTCRYINGKRDGYYTLYNIKHLINSSFFIDDKKEGIERIYSDKGKKHKTNYFYNGEIYLHKEYNISNGALIFLQHYKNGKFDGISKYRKIDGKLITLHYRNNEPYVFNITNKKKYVCCECDCGICRNGGKYMVKLPCHHYFHNYCMQDWFKQSKQINKQCCPYCTTLINWNDAQWVKIKI